MSANIAKASLISSIFMLALAACIHIFFYDYFNKILLHVHGKYLFFMFSLAVAMFLGIALWYILYRPTPLLMVKSAMGVFVFFIPLGIGFPIFFRVDVDIPSLTGHFGIGAEKETNIFDFMSGILPLFFFAYFARLYVRLGMPHNRSWANEEW